MCVSIVKSLRLRNTELVPSSISVTSLGENISLALAAYPSRYGISVKILHVEGMLQYKIVLYPIFSNSVG